MRLSCWSVYPPCLRSSALKTRVCVCVCVCVIDRARVSVRMCARLYASTSPCTYRSLYTDMRHRCIDRHVRRQEEKIYTHTHDKHTKVLVSRACALVKPSLCHCAADWCLWRWPDPADGALCVLYVCCVCVSVGMCGCWYVYLGSCVCVCVCWGVEGVREGPMYICMGFRMSKSRMHTHTHTHI